MPLSPQCDDVARSCPVRAQPAKEAVDNVTRNNPEFAEDAIEAGATWLVARDPPKPPLIGSQMSGARAASSAEMFGRGAR